MRVVFFGTPAVAIPSYDAILASRHDVVAAVTQPDRARGRSGKPSPSPIKQRAIESGVEVLQPDSPKADGFAATLRGIRPDVLAVVAYGHILPRDVLAVAPAMNVHFSLLPRYRGAAPVQRALMNGESRTGVSVFLLEPTVDTGPVIASEGIAVGPEDTAGEVFDRLAPIGARLLVDALDALDAGAVRPVEQDDAEASPAPKITPAEALITWDRPAEQIVNLIRALNPAPGAYTTLDGKRLTLWRARLAEGSGPPGSVLSSEPIVVAAGTGAVEIVELQLEGKRRLDATSFVRGRRLDGTARFGDGGGTASPGYNREHG